MYAFAYVYLFSVAMACTKMTGKKRKVFIDNIVPLGGGCDGAGGEKKEKKKRKNILKMITD